ncbi:MAG: hypothetical protein K6F99_03665 [Lachnospiraceae bacterium]|nr:hypothetical protein [Lachnospiraceae bacterium]
MKEEEYRTALAALVRYAHEKGNRISEKDYLTHLGALSMTEDEDALTRKYLSEIHIRFDDPNAPQDDFELEPESEDGNYLNNYLESLKIIEVLDDGERADLLEKIKADNEDSDKERFTRQYLKSVVDIAKLYVGVSLPLEELISVGNVGLMMAMELIGESDDLEEAEGYIGKMVMDSIDAALNENDEYRRKVEIKWD